MAITLLTPAGDVNLVPAYPWSGPPASGPTGTYAGYAEPGDLVVDVVNCNTYQNVGTRASPVWLALLHE